MSVEDNAKNLIHDVRERKEAWVKDHPDDTDMPTLIQVYRDGEHVAQAVAMPDRDKMLQAASILVFGCNANEVTLTFEAFYTELKENPLTGEEWGEGEMSFIAQEHNGVEQGWVSESLNLLAYDRDGNHLMAALPFSTKDGEVTWGEERIFIPDPEKDERVDGYVHANMVEIMRKPNMIDKAKEDLGEEGYELMVKTLGDDQFIHSDIATIKFVLKAGVAFASGLTAPKGSKRAERIDELMRASLEKDKGFQAFYPEDLENLTDN